MKPIHFLVAALLLGACASQKPSVVYTTMGEAQISADSDIVRRYLADYEKRHPTNRVEYVLEQKRHPNTNKPTDAVKVLVDAIPEGIEVSDGTFRVNQDSPHLLLGRVTLRAPAPATMRRQEIVEELQHLANVAGGNVVIMSFIGGDQESASGAVGYVLKSDLAQLDSRKARSGKLPTQI